MNTTSLPVTGYFKIAIKNGVNFDFEKQRSFFTNQISDWQWGITNTGPASAHSGTKLWATNLTGNYHNQMESMLETPEISLAGKDSAKLTFWHWYHNEYSAATFWDGGNIKISIDGEKFQLTQPVEGYDGIIDNSNPFLADQPCFGGPITTGNFWHKGSLDLSAYANHSVKVRFHFASDIYITEPGWYIDDVQILFDENTVVNLNNLTINHNNISFNLKQNFPNPFNPSTEIEYSLAKNSKVSLKIFNMLGQKIYTLVNENKPSGIFRVSWNGREKQQIQISSGIFFYRLLFTEQKTNKIFSKKINK